MAHLAAAGHEVVAVECSPVALDQFLVEQGAEAAAVKSDALFTQTIITLPATAAAPAAPATPAAVMAPSEPPLPPTGPVAEAAFHPSISWLQGDFLALAGEPDAAGPKFDGAFDRGGLVAVALEDRPTYAATLGALLKPGGKVLLVLVEHPPFSGGVLGPPHSITAPEVARLFRRFFAIEVVKREDRIDAEPAWKERGCDAFFETTYLLTRSGTVLKETAGSGGGAAAAGKVRGISLSPSDEMADPVEFWKSWNQRRAKKCNEEGKCTCFEGVGSVF